MDILAVSQTHGHIVNMMFKYLRGTIDYSSYPTLKEGHTNANWISESNGHTSSSGWIFTLGGRAVSCGSMKQKCITYTTMESEFVAFTSCGREAKWLTNLS